MTRAGLVVPPLKGRVPPDAALMYPGTAFLVEGIGVSAMTAAGYAIFGQLPDRYTIIGAILIVGSALYILYRQRVHGDK